MGHKPTKQELLEIKRTRTNKEAANYLGVSSRTVVRWLSDYDLDYYQTRYPDCKHFSDEQQEFLTACMLGAGILDKHGRFKLKMKRAVKEYVCESHALLAPFSNYCKVVDDKGTRKGKKFLSSYFVIPAFPMLKRWETVWYKNREKIVPHDLVLTPKIIAHWFVQDGHNASRNRGITIATQCFPRKDVEFLLDQLNSYELNWSRLTNNTLRLSCRSYFDFLDLVEPHIPYQCFQYKLKRGPRPRHCGAGILNMQKAQEIRRLYKSGKKRKDLAKKFACTTVTIGRVVNNIIYKRADIQISGQATNQLISRPVGRCLQYRP
jgi:hypothetical protein